MQRKAQNNTQDLLGPLIITNKTQLIHKADTTFPREFPLHTGISWHVVKSRLGFMTKTTADVCMI